MTSSIAGASTQAVSARPPPFFWEIRALCARISAKNGGGSDREPAPQLLDQAVDRHAVLRRRVALADRHGLVLQRVEVDRHAVGRADLVLPAIPLADRLRVVVLAHPV